MDHVAIDLSGLSGLNGRESQICRRRADGSIVEERRIPAAGLASYLKSLVPSRVILVMCADVFRVAGEASDAGHQVRVLSAAMARVLGVGACGGKTDTRDARLLSEASCRIEIPSLYLAPKPVREGT